MVVKYLKNYRRNVIIDLSTILVMMIIGEELLYGVKAKK